MATVEVDPQPPLSAAAALVAPGSGGVRAAAAGSRIVGTGAADGGACAAADRFERTRRQIADLVDRDLEALATLTRFAHAILSLAAVRAAAAAVRAVRAVADGAVGRVRGASGDCLERPQRQLADLVDRN